MKEKIETLIGKLDQLMPIFSSVTHGLLSAQEAEQAVMAIADNDFEKDVISLTVVCIIKDEWIDTGRKHGDMAVKVMDFCGSGWIGLASPNGKIEPTTVQKVNSALTKFYREMKGKPLKNQTRELMALSLDEWETVQVLGNIDGYDRSVEVQVDYNGYRWSAVGIETYEELVSIEEDSIELAH